MPGSVDYTRHQAYTTIDHALDQIIEDPEPSIPPDSFPPTDSGVRTPRTQSGRSGNSRRTKGTRTDVTEISRTEDSLGTPGGSESTLERSTTSVEQRHTDHKGGRRHIIHEKIITHETRGNGQPSSRHHTIVITDPESSARRERRRAEREAQQARRAERELQREQRRERRERSEARKAHSRDLERVIAALQSQARSRSSSRRSPITPTTRSATGFEEFEQLKNALTESERDLQDLRTKFREMSDRLELESKRADAAERRHKEYTQQLRIAEAARKKAETEASRESEESSRLKIIYETARSQQEHIQQELDALQQERDEAEQLAADARSKARRFQEELLVTKAREAGRKEGRREARRHHKHHRHEKEKIVERIIERVQPEQPTPQIVTESVVYDDEDEDIASQRTTPRAQTPDLPPQERTPPPPPPLIPPQNYSPIEHHSDHEAELFPDLPDPPGDIQMPEVVDPAPLPPIGGSAWSNLKNRIGGKLKRSNSRSDSYSQDSYLDDPGMYGAGRPAYSTSNRDNPSRSDLHSRSQYASPDRDMPSRMHYPPPERDMPSRSQYAPERDIPSRSQYAPERDIPSRSQYAPERDIPSRSQYASERDIPSRSQHTHDRSPTSDRYVPPPPPLVPMNGMNSMTGMTSMAGVGSMSGMGSLGGMTGLTTLVPGPGSGPGAGPGAGPGMGPGVGPGAGPVAGPSSLHIPQATHEMKASRKSSRRAKSNIPPPQPTFSSAPPTAPEAPIHPVPHNNALASPWHHKSGATFPESWIPEADDEGHIFLPPAHEIQPSPRAVDNELGERFLHPIVPSAPVPKTPKHRAGSQPTAPYTPMVFPDDYSEDYSDDMDIPIADRPDFDPMVVRTPAHYGRPLSVIPELSPENQAPPIPEAPLPSGRYSTRSKYSQPTYRQESDDRSATISVESGAGDASVHRSIRRRPSSITPTSPAPPVVQQHVPDDPRTPPPPIVPNAIIPVGPISPEPVPPVPRKTKADRQRAREAERAREEAWEMEERERVRQERAQELSERERQQQELDRRIQEQRARAAHDIERQQERERKEREREERHRERERRDGERARKEKEREQKEQEKERRHRERDLRNRTERRRGYNPTTTAPIVAPNPVVSPSPGPETSPHEPTSRIPLSEDRQITFPMPHVVPPPEQIVGPPTMIVEPPSMIVGGPSRIVEGPSRIVQGPSRIVGGPTTRIGEGPSQIGERPLTSIGEGLSQVVEGPSYVARPSEKIVIPRIVPPPSIPDDHYTPYSPISISGPASASTDPRRRSYGYAPATSATPVTPRTQPAPMKMPSPEPWHDPDNPRRRANADEAAINAYVRAVEQARKLQAGEDDDEEDEEVQRQMKAKFGDLSGNHSDEDENNEDNSEDMTSEDSESGTELSESTVSGSQQHDSTNGDSYHPGYPSNYTPGYPSNYPSSYHSNYPSNYPSTQHSNHDHDHDDRSVGPSIVLQSPSNDSNGSSAVTHTSNAQMLHPEYRHNPRQTDHSYDDPAEFESLENEPLDLSDVPPVPGLDPYSGSMASPGSRYYGLPSDYVDAPRMPRHSSASVNRPPPLATDSGYNSQWAPIRPPSAGLQPPGLPDFANFEGDFDRGKQRQDYRPPRSNPSRSSGRDSASSVGRPNIPTVPPSLVITPANTSQPSTQRTGTAELAPERTPGSGYPSAPGFATRIGAGLTGMMFSRPGFMRSPSAQQTTVPPPVVAPMTDPAPPPGAPPISGPLPSRSPITPSQGGSRAPSGMGTRPEINRVRNTLGPTLQVPMAGMGSPNRPNVVANRNKNKTMAQVEAFRALQVEQDLERQRQWDAGHGDAEMSRPSSPQESVRSKKSRAVTVVSMSDEDDWTTGRSMKGRPL